MVALDRTTPIDPSETKIDNEFYNDLNDEWWDRSEKGRIAGLHDLNPARCDYFQAAFERVHGTDPRKVRMLDIGCGGGILAEEMTRRGYVVTGADLSESSVKAATRHARESGLDIRYVVASAYELPFEDASFDAVVMSDVLEHLHDLPRGLDEAIRVLRPGGLLCFDTYNRTFFAWFIMILFGENILGIVPKGSHDWKLFIRPSELGTLLRSKGMLVREIKGMRPKMSWTAKVFSKEDKRMGTFEFNRDLSNMYVGYALKLPH